MLKTKEMQPAVRTLRGWAIYRLYAQMMPKLAPHSIAFAEYNSFETRGEPAPGFRSLAAY